MKERLLKLTSSPLSKLWLLVVFVMTCVSASAAVEWKTFETETTYKFDTKSKTYYKYTPTEDGILYIYYSAVKPGIYANCDDNGPITGYDDAELGWVSYDLGSFSWFRNNYNGSFYTSQVEYSVKANTTYYILAPDNWSGGTFIGHLEGNVTELKLKSQNFESGKMFDVTDDRYGQLELTFNVAATADQWAYLKVGNYPADSEKEKGQIETRKGSNTGSLIFNLKDSINSWMDKGYFKEGDDMTLTITGIHAKTDETIKYGTDGTLVLTFKAPGKAHNLVSYKMPSPFYSYWVKGDTAGVAHLVFDAPVMQGSEQTAKATLLIGSGDQGDAYSETLDASKISANGDTLFIDLTDKVRTYAAMGLKREWGSIQLSVYNVKMSDGTNPYSPGNGKSGSYTYSNLAFEEKNYGSMKPEFTPESGETLGSDLKIYFAKKDAFSFDGVKFTYQDQEDRKQQEIVTEGITSEPSGKDGIEYTVPVSAAMKAGKNIRLSFVGLVSTDGLTHDDLCDGVKFNPGDELTADFLPTATNIADGAVVNSASIFVLTFDEAVAVNAPKGRAQVIIKDLSVGKELPLKAITPNRRNAKQIQITSTESFKDTHKYSITVNEAVLVDSQYVKTEGKYGKYMPEKTWTFTLYKNMGNLDFVTDPIEGATLNEISTITCKTDQTKSSSTNWLSYSGITEDWVYVKLVNEKGDSIARANIKSCDNNDGFTLTFDPAITTPGTYTVVMTDSVYCLGEGYEVTPNEKEVKFSYTVIAAPEATIELTATPANESTLKSLKTITLEAEESLLGGNATVVAYNRADRKSYTGKLTLSETNANQAVITFDEEITAEGTYTIDIPEGVVGDQTWYDADFMTGKCNESMILYYTIGEETPQGNLFTTNPEANSTVTSLQNITIYVGDGTKNYVVSNGKVTLTAPDGSTLFSGDPELIVDDPNNWDEIMYRYSIALSDEATAEGVYTLTIPDGYFADENGDEIAGTTITWTIGGGDTPEPKSIFTTDPEAGSTVTSLQHIVISLGDGTKDYSASNGKVTLTAPDGTTLFSGDPDAIWPDGWDDPVYQYEITLSSAATANGVYTLTIPDGYFVDASGDEVAGTTITWTVSTTDSINGISAGKNANIKVYTLDGKAMKSAKGLKGVYIVNGKKVVLK